MFFSSALPLDCNMIGSGRSVSCVRSLGASRAPAGFTSAKSFSAEDARIGILEFSLDSVVTDLNKRGAKEGTSAPPNRWGVVAVEEEDVDVS
jgi:hypothetical protein